MQEGISGFSHETWWFSTAMLVITRGYPPWRLQIHQSLVHLDSKATMTFHEPSAKSALIWSWVSDMICSLISPLYYLWHPMGMKIHFFQQLRQQRVPPLPLQPAETQVQTCSHVSLFVVSRALLLLDPFRETLAIHLRSFEACELCFCRAFPDHDTVCSCSFCWTFAKTSLRKSIGIVALAFGKACYFSTFIRSLGTRLGGPT